VTLMLSVTVAVMFGAGAYLLLKYDMVRLVIGMVLITNAANLFIMAAGLQRGESPIFPLAGTASDPLVQAMTLTAIVISFSITALVLCMAYRVYTSHASVDIRDISQAEEVQADSDDRVGQPDPDALGAISREEEDVPDDQDPIVEGDNQEMNR
jgi:multicomponent Na+:H+ antiporter subunit C